MERVTLKPYDRYDVSTFVIRGDTVYIGHFGGSWDEDGQKLISVEEQMRQTFRNLEAALKEIGLGLRDLAKVTVILRDIGDFREMHQAWKTLFPKDPPVRTTLTSEFVENHCRVQVDGIACRPIPAARRQAKGRA